MLAFATGNPLNPPAGPAAGRTTRIEMLWNNDINPLFEAAVEATEEAIVNALVAAETMRGRDGGVVYALPHDRLIEVMQKYGRLDTYGSLRSARRANNPDSERVGVIDDIAENAAHKGRHESSEER